MKENITESLIHEAYQNLAAESVAQAVRDVVSWKVEELTKPPNDRDLTKMTDAMSADRFLHDTTRLSLFTAFSPEDMEIIVDQKMNQILKRPTVRQSIDAMWRRYDIFGSR